MPANHTPTYKNLQPELANMRYILAVLMLDEYIEALKNLKPRTGPYLACRIFNQLFTCNKILQYNIAPPSRFLFYKPFKLPKLRSMCLKSYSFFITIE